MCPNSEQRAFWFPEKSGFMKKFPLTRGLAPRPSPKPLLAGAGPNSDNPFPGSETDSHRICIQEPGPPA